MTPSNQGRSIRSGGHGSPPRRPDVPLIQPGVDRNDADLEFRVDLADVPVPPPALMIDGLKPTLLSRLLRLFQR